MDPKPAAPTLTLKGQTLALSKPLIMGVLNASPESFSGDGRPLPVAEKLALATSLVDDGADIVDVGGQSAVTNQDEISEQEEIDRVLPVITFMAATHPSVLVSIDAYRPRVVAAALEAGAAIVNDVSGLLYPEIVSHCVTHRAALVVMHTRARPKVRLQEPDLYGPHPDGVVADVVAFLQDRIERAVSLGLDPHSSIVDPGPDFTKTPHQTLTLLQNLDHIRALGRPVVMALSRKDFLGAITHRRPADRDPATHAAIALLASTAGSIVRVHDVAATRDVLDTAAALAGRTGIDPTFLLSDQLRYQKPRP